VWNAPTWFLSALAFALLVLPHVLPAIAALRKKGLRALLVVLTIVSLLPKVAYSYDLGCWTILEGMCGARSHPNLMVFNIVRFNPFFCMLEVRLGGRGWGWEEVCTAHGCVLGKGCPHSTGDGERRRMCISLDVPVPYPPPFVFP
jgi:peptidoglycan/LPS O-acetylase OafA/YrhL